MRCYDIELDVTGSCGLPGELRTAASVCLPDHVDGPATAVVERLRAGTVVDGAPAVEVATLVGMGQSMGGCLLTVQQADHATFDGVAVLQARDKEEADAG